MDTITNFLITIFKTYGVSASLGLIFLWLLFYKAFPVMIDIIRNFIAVVKELGDKLEKASEKTSEDLGNIMAEFKVDRQLSREAHISEINSMMTNNEKSLNFIISAFEKKMANG